MSSYAEGLVITATKVFLNLNTEISFIRATQVLVSSDTELSLIKPIQIQVEFTFRGVVYSATQVLVSLVSLLVIKLPYSFWGQRCRESGSTKKRVPSRCCLVPRVESHSG